MATASRGIRRTFTLPFEPLWRASRCTTHEVFAEVVGATRASIENYHTKGYISWTYADRYACALGFHPWEIWGDAWFGDMPEAKVEAVA